LIISFDGSGILIRRGVRTAQDKNSRALIRYRVDAYFLLIRVHCPMSYSGLDAPISHLSNQPTMCSSRSIRCQGCPERESSWDSFGKRTITVGIFLYFSARNISSPPAPVGVRQSASPRINISGVFTLLI